MWDIPSCEQVLNKQVFVPKQELQGHVMLGSARRRTGGSWNLLFQITFSTSQCQEDGLLLCGSDGQSESSLGRHSLPFH